MDLSSTEIVLPDVRAVSTAGVRKCLPIEFWVAAFFSAIFMLGLNLGLPLNWPDGVSLRFVQQHYFTPLLGAFCLQMILPFLMQRGHKSDRLLMVKVLPFMVIVVLLHFNFKAWMPLVNPRCYDDLFFQIDQWLAPVTHAFAAIRTWIASLLPFNVDNAYHGLFVAIFFISLAMHAAFDEPVRQRQLVLGLCLILLVGGICYWVAPAIGPFLYAPGLNASSQEAQGVMLHMFQGVVQTGTLPEGYFTAPLAAMPSLHVAHALFLTMFAFRSLRWLFFLYLPVFFWIVIESVASGWHYVIDLPFGAFLAIFCYSLARGFLPEPAQPGPEDRAGSAQALTSSPLAPADPKS